MRVLHYCDAFSALTETFIYDYIAELERKGIDNYVVTLDRQNAGLRPFHKVRTIRRPGRWSAIRVAVRAFAAARGVAAHASWWPMVRWRLARELRALRPDVVHAHFGPAGVLAAPVALRFGVPLIATFYGYDVSTLPRKSHWLEHYSSLWMNASAVVVLSENMRRRVVELGCPVEKTHVVHLSRRLDDAVFRLPNRYVKRFIAVGRLVPKKGHVDAIRAVGIARKNGGADISLDIVGEGPLRADLERAISANNLEGHVKLIGALPNDEVVRLMYDADAMILCSRTGPDGDEEGTPTVLIEAQLVGLPCVTTDHAGIPEMLPSSCRRFVVPEGDIDAAARSIEELARCSPDELRKMAMAGREKMETEFNLKVESTKLAKIYAAAVPRMAPARSRVG